LRRQAKGDIIETDVDLAETVKLHDVEKRLWKFTRLDDDPVRPPTSNRSTNRQRAESVRLADHEA
jgi:hypothetical protein